MKNKLIFFLCSSFALQANVALSPESPLFPEEGLFLAKESFATLKSAYFCDYIFKTNLKNKHDISHATQSSLTQFGALCLCLSDLVDLWGFVGTQNNTIKFKKHHVYNKFSQNSAFSWALYGSGILNQWGRLQLGVGGFYSSTPYQKGKMSETDLGSFHTRYQSYSWGVDLGFAWDYAPCAPYARLDFQYSKSRLQYMKNNFFHTMHPLGLAFGFTSDLTHGFFIDFEFRIVQTYATRLLAGIRF